MVLDGDLLHAQRQQVLSPLSDQEFLDELLVEAPDLAHNDILGSTRSKWNGFNNV